MSLHLESKKYIQTKIKLYLTVTDSNQQQLSDKKPVPQTPNMLLELSRIFLAEEVIN